MSYIVKTLKRQNRDMKTKVDDVLLMKYMQGLCTEKETDEISRWIEESE